MEYASVVWDPYHQCNTQRGAAWLCNNDYMYRHTYSVTAMIKDLEWDSIGFLPQKSSVVHHEQGTRNTDPREHGCVPKRPTRETQTCGTYDFKYFIEFSRNVIYKFSYFPRAIMWNSLPS